MKLKLLILILSVVSISIKGQPSANPAENIIPVLRCSDFEVTGEGNNDEWEKATWQELTSNVSSPPSAPLTMTRQISYPYTTRFKILYSTNGIYCLYDCADTKITATMMGDNLDLWNEDVVEAFFWADQSLPVYFEYELSPLNQELVLMVPNYNGRFLGWIPWHYEGARLTKHRVSIKKDGNKITGWYGEFFIPYDLMKPMIDAVPEKGHKWRANFYRIDYDGKDPVAWTWMPIVNNFHDYQLFGTIEFR